MVRTPHTSTAGGTSLIPGQGTKILQATQYGQKKKKEKEEEEREGKREEVLVYDLKTKLSKWKEKN